MKRKLVFNVKDVEAFSPPDADGAYESRMLVDSENAGADTYVINHFTLKKSDFSDPGGRHPAPFDETYYVLRGTGRLSLGEPPEQFDLTPGTVVFIPGGTFHSINNLGPGELEILTVMTGPLAAGANPLYDARKQAWGTSFRLRSG